MKILKEKKLKLVDEELKLNKMLVVVNKIQLLIILKLKILLLMLSYAA